MRSIRTNKWRPRWGRRRRRRKGTGAEGKYYSNRPSGLWVYAIKNVNICRRLVIGCKYGGSLKPDEEGWISSSFVSLFIGMWGTTVENPRSTAPTILGEPRLALDPASQNVSIHRARASPSPRATTNYYERVDGPASCSNFISTFAIGLRPFGSISRSPSVTR